MKRIIFSLIVLFAFAFSMNGQRILRPLPLLDTVTNAGTSYHDITVSGSYNSGVIQYVGTEISGTTAGTAILYGSVDGTNYVSLLDTLAQTDVTTNTKIWTQTRPIYPYYRVLITGSGTMSQQTKCYAHFKN